MYSRTSITAVRVRAHPFYGGRLYTFDIYASSKLENFMQLNIIAVAEHMELLQCGKLYKCVINQICNVIFRLLLGGPCTLNKNPSFLGRNHS